MMRILTLLMLLIFLMPAVLFAQNEPSSGEIRDFPFAPFVGSVVKSIKIEIKDCPWCTPQIENLARDLINLHENELFTEQGYRQSLEALGLSKWFEEITPFLERAEGGIVVTFSLKPYWEIKDIKIDGEYPIFESEVLKAMGVYSGDILIPDALESQEKQIIDLYKREGYINPAVSITAEKNPDDGTAVLSVHIKPGTYYVLDPLKIRGNVSYPDTEIKALMYVWRTSFFLRESRRFREADLQQDIKNLTSLYWQRGYTECEIHYTLNKDDKNGKVTALVSISEGPLYEVSIEGNEKFWAYTLKEDIVIFHEGNKRDRGISKSIKNIKQRYRLAGYPFTDVAVLEEKTTIKEKMIRRLELSILEGPQTIVDSVWFTGNTAFDEDKLRKTMQTGKASLFGKKIYVPDILDEDLAAIQALYLKHGYNDAKVSYETALNDEKTSVNITMVISEGVKTIASSVKVSGVKSISEKKAFQILQIKEGGPFRNDLIKTGEAALSDLISEKGHPYVMVKGETSFSNDRTKADVIFHVDEGQYVKMGNTYYRGNFKTRTSAIRRELDIQPGDPFSLKTMLEGQKEIRNMEIFNSVQLKTIGLKEKMDHTTLLMDMEEKEPYYLQAGAGYESDRGLYGNTRAGDRNLFGLNKDAWIGGEVSQIGYNGELDITQRRIFGTPVSSTFAQSYERKEEFNQDFGTSVWTTSLTFLRDFKPKPFKTSLGFRYEWRDEFPKDPSQENPDTFDPRGIFITTPFVSYDTRDSFVRPKKGMFSSLSVDISKGMKNSFDNFLKYYLNLRFYLSPVHRLTFAWLGRLGYINQFGTESHIPDDQLFYLGGTLSVRGYDENMLRFDENKDPVGGRTAVVGSMEARYELNPDWETALFYDTGSVQRALVDAGSDKFRSSVGIAMRYITPIGPIGLLYGHKIHPEESESAGRFHISIGYTF